MSLFYNITAIWLTVITVLPATSYKHWVFRIPDFGRIQIAAIQLLVLVLGVILCDYTFGWWAFTTTLLFALGYQLSVLIPYFPTKKTKLGAAEARKRQIVSIISANVYQYNEQHHLLIDLVNSIQPDILLTIESDKAWEKSMEVLETKYPNFKKVALENTYGMHLYTSLEIKSLKTHYLISEKIPSIEAHLVLDDGQEFVFFGVHPPPPSPTEEKTAKPKDGELLQVAKKVKETSLPSIVIGDFNTVAWSNISKLFGKVSGLEDSRKGRGIISTFPAKYKLFQFPIDLLFHSKNILIQQLKTLSDIGSDHLPIYCDFFISEEVDATTSHHLSESVEKKAEKVIEKGKKTKVQAG